VVRSPQKADPCDEEKDRAEQVCDQSSVRSQDRYRAGRRHRQSRQRDDRQAEKAQENGSLSRLACIGHNSRRGECRYRQRDAAEKRGGGLDPRMDHRPHLRRKERRKGGKEQIRTGQ
jgi:hypothetical protein